MQKKSEKAPTKVKPKRQKRQLTPKEQTALVIGLVAILLSVVGVATQRSTVRCCGCDFGWLRRCRRLY